jgi:hypothetical protein
MSTPQLRPPTWWARAAVMVATRRLPVGEVRLRYRLELLAELWGTPARRQASYAWGTLCASRSLVRAVRHPDPTAETRPPLACRLRLRHRWHTVSADDGSSHWRECVHCGHEAPHNLSIGQTF